MALYWSLLTRFVSIFHFVICDLYCFVLNLHVSLGLSRWLEFDLHYVALNPWLSFMIRITSWSS